MKFRVFDAHCDTAMELWMQRQPLYENTLDVSLRRAERLAGYAQFFAFCTVWVEQKASDEQIFRCAEENFRAELERNSGRAALCRTAAEAEQAMQAGKTAAFLSIEGAEAIGCDPGRLEEAYALGVRMIAPCWNRENALTGSCMTGGGLTAQGREFCRRAQKLGILLDVSHMSEAGFWDLAELAERPIVASHSNSKAVCGNVRNLTDRQFRAIAELGGAAGLNLYSAFLTDGRATMDDCLRHLEHWLELDGDGHICLGGDLDGCSELPEGFDALDSYAALADHLQSHGMPEDVLRRLFSDSLMEVVKACIM